MIPGGSIFPLVDFFTRKMVPLSYRTPTRESYQASPYVVPLYFRPAPDNSKPHQTSPLNIDRTLLGTLNIGHFQGHQNIQTKDPDSEIFDLNYSISYIVHICYKPPSNFLVKIEKKESVFLG